jgi:myo-inositol 2-dehydrogenase/D-chiro-inositol 1-dehydrogenase
MRPIRVGVVGLNFGMEHLAALTINERFEIAAVCDQDAVKLGWLRGEPVRLDHEAAWYRNARRALVERVRTRSERLAETKLVQDFDALLAMDEVEAVFLALPCHLNAPFAVRALAAGKHCFSSKPFALTREQGEALLGAVRASDRVFMLGFQFRHSPLFKQVRRMIDAGHLGQVKQLWWNMTRMPLRPSHNRRELSGGPYLAECCHWLDLMEFFQPGARFTRVAAFGGLDLPDTHVDFADNAVTIVDYDSGVRGSLNFTYFTHQPEYNVFGIQGTGGKIRGDTEQAGRFVMWSGATQDRTDFVANPSKAWQGHLGFDANQDAFAELIRSGDHARSVDEAERGMENLLVCLAAERALDEGRVITRAEV